MLGPSIKLPDTTPRWMLVVILFIAAIYGGLFLFPELRTAMWQSITHYVPKLASQELPKDCQILSLSFDAHESGSPKLMRLVLSKNAGAVTRCNPPALRNSGETSVTDVLQTEKNTGSLVTVRVENGTAKLGLPSDNEGGEVVAFGCRPKVAVYHGKWGSFQPASLIMDAVEAREHEVVFGLCQAYPPQATR